MSIRRALLVFAVLLALAITGWSGAVQEDESGKPTQGVTLSTAIYGNTALMLEWMQEMAADLGMEIDAQLLPDGEQNEVIYRTKAATKDLPDLIKYHPGPKFKSDIVPTENCADLSNEPWVEKIPQGMLTLYEVENKVYGVPLGGTNGAGVFYNKKIFREAGVDIPETLDELYTACKKIKQAGYTPLFLSGKDAWSLQQVCSAAFAFDMRDDPTILNRINSNQASFTDAKNLRKTVEFLLKLKNDGLVNSDFLSATYDNAHDAIMTGEAAMYVMGTWVMGAFNSKYPENINDVGFFIWPIAGEKVLVGIGPALLAATNYSKNVDATKEFLRFFMTQEGQDIFYKHEPFSIPVIKGITVNKELTSLESEVEQTAREVELFQCYDFTTIVNLGDFGPYMQDVYVGEKTPQQFLETLMSILRRKAQAEKIPGF